MLCESQGKIFLQLTQMYVASRCVTPIIEAGCRSVLSSLSSNVGTRTSRFLLLMHQSREKLVPFCPGSGVPESTLVGTIWLLDIPFPKGESCLTSTISHYLALFSI